MESQARIYVLFSDEVKARLNNRIDLQKILADAGIDGDVERQAVPSSDPNKRTKALVETVAIASFGAVSVAAAIKLLESTITHFLNNKAVRDSHYAYWVNEPVLDGKGRTIKDTAGEVRLVRRRIGGFDEFPAIPGEGVTLSVSEKGFDMKAGGDVLAPMGDSEKTS